MQSQYHSGEREAQRLAGEQDIADAREGMMQPRIAVPAVRWLSAQTLLAIATRDPEDRPWASVLTGRPGFLHAEDSGAGLWIDQKIPGSICSDLKRNSAIGLLAIDLATRQRMRVNGKAHTLPSGLYVTVQESFFNCPKYITRRLALPSDAAASAGQQNGADLRAEHLQLLHETDVLFMATAHPERGLDVSHRGGDAGFVQLLPDGTLRIPDYPGNSLFNSLGNLLVDPRVGIAVPNLRTGEVLEITGRATIAWRDADPADSTGGTHRFIDITPEAWRMAPGGPTASHTAEPSPYNPHERPAPSSS
jgi:predicted pyridoxine 5'-phosphate oxidase superfamily flavin-nucleotide-binding protein